MTPKKFFTFVALITAAAVIALVLFHRLNTEHPGGAPGASTTASAPKLKWTFKPDNNSAVASIVIGKDGTIFAGANNGIYAIAPDGTRQWKTQIAGLLYLAGSDEGTLYVASSYGLIFSVLSNGTLSWKPGQGLIGFGGPPAIGKNGYVFFANTVSDLFAFRPGSSTSPDWSQGTFREGIVNVNSSLPGEARVGGAQSRNTPAIWRDETMALPRQHWIHLFYPDGSSPWFSELTPGQLGPAALADDGTIYVADDRRTFFAVRRSGDTLWQFTTDGMVMGSAVVGADNTIYFATSNSVYALTPEGSLKWQIKAPQQATTAPALADDGTVYVGGATGFFAIRSDGSLKWTLRTMSATGAPTIAADGTIYYPCGYQWVCALQDEGSPLAKSPWPKMYHDPANTSRILTVF
ncbi:MAG: PQQ-binding-like beta-propeller repeat protein [Candidatus Acidiferrales bacterium]